MPDIFILQNLEKQIADMIYERHELLSSWLVRLGVPEEIATEDACRIEHVISKESFAAIKNHVKITLIILNIYYSL